MKKPGILELRPTQFVLGMKEIEDKVSKLKTMKDKELAAYCKDHAIPVVLGPKQQHYMIDHHHFARACWETGVDTFLLDEIKDLSDMSEEQFWNAMIKKEWVYLHDQFGMGPHSPYDLPADIRCLADDPYRSLAWALRDAGAIKKQPEPFFEFKWAAFFRLNLDVRLHSKSQFKDAIAQAKRLAESKAASHLPGYVSGK
jgi:hypothetical protein